MKAVYLLKIEKTRQGRHERHSHRHSTDLKTELDRDKWGGKVRGQKTFLKKGVRNMRWPEPGSGRISELVEETKRIAQPFSQPKDLEEFAQNISCKRLVMLGEASHGTHEFYEWRRHISQMLIQNHGFNFIAVEGDWPPCWDLNDYIHGTKGGDARAALAGFHRWPTWMWANSDVFDLVKWMKAYNSQNIDQHRAGFYGLDVYSLFESIEAVIARLEQIDPRLAQIVRGRYECFEPFQRDEKAYARSLLLLPEGCEKEVIKNLKLILEIRLENLNQSAPLLFSQALFDAQQNARIVTNAENYYRTMVQGDEDSWNVRDSHMLETLKNLLDRYGPESKAIVWAHNTHIGDHRATDMVEKGQANIGGLARQAWGEDHVALVGFGTYQGEVIASHAWGAPMERMEVPPGREGSIEDGFHRVAKDLKAQSFVIDLKKISSEKSHVFRQIHGHRAIGVVYNPDYERFGNYVPTSLSERYDAFLFFDQTTALRPLIQSIDRTEIPETWPQGV